MMKLFYEAGYAIILGTVILADAVTLLIDDLKCGTPDPVESMSREKRYNP